MTSIATILNDNPSHARIFKISGDEKAIVGGYYLGIFNQTSSDKLFTTQITLPKETFDFAASQGITNKDIFLSKNGDIEISKNYPPGMTLVGISFKVMIHPVFNDTISFELRNPIAEFTIATNKEHGLSLYSNELKPGLSQMLATGEYTGIMGTSLKPGQNIYTTISGIPKNNMLSCLLGFCGLIILLILAFVFGARNHKELKKLHKAYT